jgi:tetratricopeptide (TPR) repeat protein
MKAQRNDPCPCQSGKKYKKCCSLIDEHEALALTQTKHSLRNTHFTIEIRDDIDDECQTVFAKIESGDLVGAKKIAQCLYREHPESHMVNFAQGVCLISEDRHSDAIVYFEKAVNIYPYFAEAFYNLGNLYLKQINIPDAVDCFKRVIEIQGRCGETGKKAHESLRELESMVIKDPGCTLDEYVKGARLFNRAFACLSQKNYHTAILLFQQVLAIDPEHVQAHGNMALAYSGLGQNNRAMELLMKALSIDPTYEPALNNMIGIAQLKEGELLSLPMKRIEYYKDGMGL